MTRFDSVIDQFCDVIDAKSGYILLHPKALEVVKLLRKHIEAGCLSKPDGVPLYYATGKSKAGITTCRCVRVQGLGVCVLRDFSITSRYSNHFHPSHWPHVIKPDAHITCRQVYRMVSSVAVFVTC